MAAAILRLPAVQTKVQLSRSSIYRLEAEGQFPKRVQLGTGHSVGWYLHEVEEWLATRPRVSDAPKKAA